MGPLAVNQFVLRFAQQTELSELGRCLAIVEPQENSSETAIVIG